jgi:hypothetical protein
MITGIQHLHHYLPFIFLLLLVISIVRATSNKISDVNKDKLLLITLILAHIQFLLGMVLLFPFPEVEMGVIMKDAARRFKYIEHPSMMFLAVMLITIGRSKAKKIEDVAKANKTISITFLIALVLILLRTPWDKIF